ncbi:MAG: hypothetical protein C0609_01210 [Deltaproteobacteria bacterium]|nr:MAG: hypothetical protein C0609_01210 [Deltaproteobacteria bacterium]
MAYTKTLENFIPEIWSKQLLRNWDDEFIMRKLVNTRYEGEITAFGDTVHVPYLGNISVADYDNSNDSPISYQDVDDLTSTLSIDQRKYWAFKVEDVEKAQSTVEVREEYTKRAAVAMKDEVEEWLLGSDFCDSIGQIVDATGTAGAQARANSTAYSLGDFVQPSTANGYVYKCTTAGTSAGSAPTFPTILGATVTDGTVVWTNWGYIGHGKVTNTNLYKTLVSAKKAFRKANTWIEGDMWAVIPPEIEELILTYSELTHATERGDQLLEQGLMGKLAGFKLYCSNNVSGAGSSASPFRILCGNKETITFAEQITETEAVRLENEFATGVRGLMVYGGTIFDRNKYAGVEIFAELG